MNFSEKPLLRKLIIAVVIKMLALTVLWLVFIRQHHLEVDGPHVANHVLGQQQSQDAENKE